MHAIRCPLCPQTKIKLTIFGLGSTARQNLFKIHPAVLPIKDRQTDRQTNRQTNRQRYCLTVGFNLYLPVTSKLKSLGVTIDSNLRFDCHARNVAKACNFHIRALRHVRSLLTDDAPRQSRAALSLPGWTTAMHC